MPDDLRLEAARGANAVSSDAPVAAQQFKKPKNQHPRLFLDLFAGVNAPLTAAMHAQGSDYFQPFDLGRDPKCNILDDSVFAILLRVAWSGLVGAVWSAPPCKEYSRLKLRPRAKPFMTGDDRYCMLRLAPQVKEDWSNRPAAWLG